MDSEAIKMLVIAALEDIKAQDIIDLDVRRQTDITDYMVIAGGTTPRQVKALANKVIAEAKIGKIPVLGVEGMETGEWVLIDLVDVIVHVMLPTTRTFYELERLWSFDSARPLPGAGTDESAAESVSHPRAGQHLVKH